MKKNIGTVIRFLFVYALIFTWVFSGFPHLRFVDEIELPPDTVRLPNGQYQQTRIAHVVRSVRTAHADTSGPNNPAAGASTASGSCTNSVNWGTLTNAGSNNTAYVQITGTNWDAAEVSDELELSQFGFAVTAGSIDGIQVEVLGWGPLGGAHAYTDVRLMTSSGVYVGTDKAAGTLPTADPGSTYTSFGGSADTWSASLTAAQVNATTFGTALCWTAAGANSTINIDHVRVTITYTPPATFTQSAYKWFANTETANVGAGSPINQSVVAPPQDRILRLRMLLHNSGGQLSTNGTTTKLQFAERSGTCDTAFSGESYADITNTTAIAYASTSKGVAAQGASPQSLFFRSDGLRMYVTDSSSGGEVNQYNLSVAWSVSTAAFAATKSITEDTTTTGIFFNPNGLEMLILGLAGTEVDAYGLSSAWDVSTAGLSAVGSVGDDTSPRGLFFKPNGLKMYVSGDTGNEINEYNLVSAWLPNTASFVQTKSISAQTSDPRGLFFRDDGLKMYLVGAFAASEVNEYNLTTAWDISTLSFVQAKTITGAVGLTGIFFKPDGTKMYLSDQDTSLNHVKEYNLTSPWDISTTEIIATLNGDNLTANNLDPQHETTGTLHTVVNQDYVTINNFTNSVAAIPNNQDGKWDFALRDLTAPPNTTYCIRAVQSGAGVLGGYTVVPEITTTGAVRVRLVGNVRLRKVRMF